jgi:hypothetical protein
MLTQAQAIWLQTSIIIATLLSPIVAVLITTYLQDRKTKKSAQLELFKTLYSLRGSPVNYYYVNALNTIELIFDDSERVLASWKDYYSLLGNKDKESQWLDCRVRMLSAMAAHLGYEKLDVNNFVDHYLPEGLGHLYQSDLEIRDSLVPFLRSQAELNALLIARLNEENKEIHS